MFKIKVKVKIRLFWLTSQVSDVKSLALHDTSINLVLLERGSLVEYVFPCFQLGKLDLGVT